MRSTNWFALYLIIICCFVDSFAYSQSSGLIDDEQLDNRFTWHFNTLNNHHYAISKKSETWVNAESIANELSGYLVSINNAQENAWIFANILPVTVNPGIDELWIGLQIVGGAPQWTSGEPVEYTNFTNESDLDNKNILRARYLRDGQWMTDPGTSTRHYIIEIPSSESPELTPAPDVDPSIGTIYYEDYSEAIELNDSLIIDSPQGYTKGALGNGVFSDGLDRESDGLILNLPPGNGVFLINYIPVNATEEVKITTRYRASNDSTAFALIAMNYPIDNQFGYINLTGKAISTIAMETVDLYYSPPSGDLLTAIQVVNPPFATFTSTIWIDYVSVKAGQQVSKNDALLAVDGSFDNKIDQLLANINGDTGTITPFFQSFSDVAMRLSIKPKDKAANIGTISPTLSSYQYPFNVFGSVYASKMNANDRGTAALVVTNGFQNLGVFRLVNDLPLAETEQPEALSIGGSFQSGNDNLPVTVVVQNGGPNEESSIVVDDLSLETAPKISEGLASQITVDLPLPNNATQLELALIPSGTFLMGSPPEERGREEDEGPQHFVTITKPFYMGKYDITVAQWESIMGSGTAPNTGQTNRPVISISKVQAGEFIRRLNNQFHGLFRFPSEAEYEYACRAGTATPYYWGETLDARYAWFDQNSVDVVGARTPNRWGLYDMSGNVWNWCVDWYGPYTQEHQIDPTGPESGDTVVVRGGVYGGKEILLRSAGRHYYNPNGSSISLGMRIVRNAY